MTDRLRFCAHLIRVCYICLFDKNYSGLFVWEWILLWYVSLEDSYLNYSNKGGFLGEGMTILGRNKRFWTGLFSCMNLNWRFSHGWTWIEVFPCTWWGLKVNLLKRYYINNIGKNDICLYSMGTRKISFCLLVLKEWGLTVACEIGFLCISLSTSSTQTLFSSSWQILTSSTTAGTFWNFSQMLHWEIFLLDFNYASLRWIIEWLKMKSITLFNSMQCISAGNWHSVSSCPLSDHFGTRLGAYGVEPQTHEHYKT